MNQQQEERLFNMVQDTHDTVIEINTKVKAIEKICPAHAAQLNALETYKDKMDGRMSIITAIVSATVALIVAMLISVGRSLMGEK